MDDNTYKIVVKVLSYLIAILITPFIFIPLTIFTGWTFATVWNMLLVKAFMLPVLSVPKAIAIDLVVSWLTYRYTKDDRKFTEKLGEGISLNLMFLFLGFILSHFI